MKVFIVHGWGGNPDTHWLPWLKKELERKGYIVKVPQMPNTNEPKIDEWVSHLKKVVGKVDEDIYFVGHSIGCQTIMRFIEKENIKVKKVIFVAGWFNLDNLEDDESKKIAAPWITKQINFGELKKKIGETVVFLSDNEPYGYVEENKKMFTSRLNARVIVEREMGHFTGEDNVTKLPKVLKEITG